MNINVPQPSGEVLIALRLKDQLKQRCGLNFIMENDPCFKIVTEILQGFIIMETTESKNYI